MALAQVNFFSQTLWMNCSMNVVLPQRALIPQGPGKRADLKWPVLYLLHGASEDHSAWQRHTAVERYAEARGLAVVMPAAQLSFYSNMAHGGAYFDFFSEELPRTVCEFFPISSRREDTFIAGSSMGAYGAMKIGLSKPERFSAIGCFSLGSITHVEKAWLDQNPLVSRLLRLAFGEEDPAQLRGTEHDLAALADKAVAAGKPLPRIFHACGLEDDPAILKLARLTRAQIQNTAFEYAYSEGPGGHTWDFWDEWLQKFLNWLMV